MKRIKLPLTKSIRTKLKAGEELLLSGVVYTARDAAHKRLCNSIKKKEALPVILKDTTIYYCGPTPAPPGYPIGSCGPTTSKRMDNFMPTLLRQGLAATIGKGRRAKELSSEIRKYKSVYLITVGGAGAYLAKRIKKAKVIAYKDLGPEAIYELIVEDFPVIVAIDSHGRCVYR